MDYTSLISSALPAVATGLISYFAAVSKSKSDIEKLKLSHQNEIEKLQLSHQIELEKLKAQSKLNSDNVLNEAMAKIIPEVFVKVLSGEIKADDIKQLENTFKK